MNILVPKLIASVKPVLKNLEFSDLAESDVLFNEGIDRVAVRLRRVPLSLVENDETYIGNHAGAEWPKAYKIFKRSVDLATAVVFGIATLPFLPLIALAIKVDSPGPVIYQQTRLGQNNAHFLICKFRTMTVDAEANGAVYASQNDPRITRLGKFMRRTRIDEIPQLWNILLGDMSLVGPRPERPENLAMLESAIPCFSVRTTVRPGVTGWAQVSSVNYASTAEETGRKVEYDFYYLAFGSIWLDLEILARTVGVVAKSRGR